MTAPVRGYTANKKAYASVADSLKVGTHASVATQLRTNGSGAPTIAQPFLESLQKHVANGPPS